MRPPNLLFVITDQQAAHTTAPNSPCPMPHLQQLAERGTRFERCYTVNPICSPTRASLITGVLPHTHGMVDCTHAVPEYRARFDAALPVWPRQLQQAGYHTGYFGKWHIERSNRLENFGFDEYDVEQYHQVLGLVERNEQMLRRGAVRQKGYRDFLLYGVVDAPVEETAEYRLFSRGIGFVQQATQQPDQPWALFLSTEAPHDPYVVPADYYRRVNPAEIPRPASFDDPLTDRPAIYRRLQQVWRSLDWPDFAQATACYYAFCAMIDDQLGRIIQSLRENNQLDNTLIVFTSDHGDYMGAHRLLLKGIPAFEEAYHVPLILAGPGIPAGQRVPQTVSLLDLPRTLAQLTTGADFPCQGRSLLPLLGDAPPQNWANEAYAECHGQRFYYTQRVLWQEHFKYVFNGFDEDELYDLSTDPHELRNLAADPGHQPRLEQMAARMWAIARETGDDNLLQAQYGMFRFAPVGPENLS
ncbi:MAG: sulfatase-like hydrolase/transferase [Anaerolineae bacterium]